MQDNKILRDTLDNVEEMTKLIEKSPKRQVLFEKIQGEIACDSPGIRLLAPTRWTVRAQALISISDNYETLRDTWYVANQESKDSEMRARISGVAKQMESFDFLFGIELGQKVLCMADNLSSTLRGSKVSACDGQSVVKMTFTALQTIRSDEGFSLFWKLVEQKQLKLDVDEPKLPRQRKVPRRYEVGSSIPDQSHQTSVQDMYKHTYFEVIDYVMQAITSKFDQKGYKTLANLEHILCNEEANLNDYNDGFELYESDFNRELLETQLVVLHSNLSSDIKSEHGGAKVKIIIGYLQNSSKCEKEFYSEVIKLCKIILVMPATNALSERSFSILRRLKTWLRSTMQQTRLNWCMILHTHTDETDELDLRAIANEFVCRNSSRQRIFGHF